MSTFFGAEIGSVIGFQRFPFFFGGAIIKIIKGLFFRKIVTFCHFFAPFSKLKMVGSYGFSFLHFFFGGAILKATYGSLFLKKGHFLMPKRPQNEEVGDFFQSDPQIVLSIVSFEVKSY